MRALIQKVKSGKVSVEGKPIAKIGHGLVIMLGIGQGDTEEKARFLAEKTATLRVFTDFEGKFNQSLLDVNGEALVISQFTLYSDTRKGRRPSFSEAARPEVAAPLVEKFAGFLSAMGLPVQTGSFGAHMLVEIENDGPVTMMLEK
jgi:D-tyrosyl-tRNA(Tyr) deacylase